MTARAADAPEVANPEADPYEERHFGFWLYLMSDAIIFALLFATYAVMMNNTAGGPAAAQIFSIPRAAAETGALLLSTFTMALAMLGAYSGRQRMAVIWLVVTGLLGAVFLFLEIGEFRELIAKGAGPDRSGFLSSFFALVGTHGLHVTAGIVWLLVMLAQIAVKGMTPPVVSRLFRLALFWHFLDIVWIGIFSFVYLAGAA